MTGAEQHSCRQHTRRQRSRCRRRCRRRVKRQRLARAAQARQAQRRNEATPGGGGVRAGVVFGSGTRVLAAMRVHEPLLQEAERREHLVRPRRQPAGPEILDSIGARALESAVKQIVRLVEQLQPDGLRTLRARSVAVREWRFDPRRARRFRCAGRAMRE